MIGEGIINSYDGVYLGFFRVSHTKNLKINNDTGRTDLCYPSTVLIEIYIMIDGDDVPDRLKNLKIFYQRLKFAEIISIGDKKYRRITSCIDGEPVGNSHSLIFQTSVEDQLMKRIIKIREVYSGTYPFEITGGVPNEF